MTTTLIICITVFFCVDLISSRVGKVLILRDYKNSDKDKTYIKFIKHMFDMEEDKDEE